MTNLDSNLSESHVPCLRLVVVEIDGFAVGVVNMDRNLNQHLTLWYIMRKFEFRFYNNVMLVVDLRDQFGARFV